MEGRTDIFRHLVTHAAPVHDFIGSENCRKIAAKSDILFLSAMGHDLPTALDTFFRIIYGILWTRVSSSCSSLVHLAYSITTTIISICTILFYLPSRMDPFRRDFDFKVPFIVLYIYIYIYSICTYVYSTKRIIARTMRPSDGKTRVRSSNERIPLVSIPYIRVHE